MCTDALLLALPGLPRFLLCYQMRDSNSSTSLTKKELHIYELNKKLVFCQLRPTGRHTIAASTLGGPAGCIFLQNQKEKKSKLMRTGLSYCTGQNAIANLQI